MPRKKPDASPVPDHGGVSDWKMKLQSELRHPEPPASDEEDSTPE